MLNAQEHWEVEDQIAQGAGSHHWRRLKALNVVPRQVIPKIKERCFEAQNESLLGK